MDNDGSLQSRPELIRTLKERIGSCASAFHPKSSSVSAGHRTLDQFLPDGGLCRGTLVEWLAAQPGSGADTLALIAAREASLDGGVIVVVDRQRIFYPPAALTWKLKLEKLLVVRPQSLADERWAVDQALRSPGVAAVLAWPDRMNDREFRRWQLAAEASDTLGLLVRPAKARDEPSWAELRFWVQPLPVVIPGGNAI